MTGDCSIREAAQGDAECIAALATLVFLDTYAPDGLRPDLAREAFAGYSIEAFAARLNDREKAFLLAERAGHLVGFVECTHGADAPALVAGALEVTRLYVHPRFQRRGIGKALLSGAEKLAHEHKLPGTWLSAWAGNARALAFYASVGYKIVGSIDHLIEGTRYENHVLARQFGSMH